MARPFSKGLLVWHVIPRFRFSSCAFTRIRVRQRAHGFASVDDTEWRFAQLAYWSLRRRVSLRGTSILRLRRAPSPRGCSVGVSYRTFISHPARYVAYERGKALSTSLPLTIRSSALHSCHTDRCVEGCLFEAHPSCAFGAPLLQGATRIICNTVLSFLFLRIYSHTSESKSPRLRFR